MFFDEQSILSYLNLINMDVFYLAVPPILEGCMFIALARFYIQKHKDLRSTITSRNAWVTQFFCGPLIIFAALMYASRLGVADGPWLAMLLTPVLFNFGVEPSEQPDDIIFELAFYSHHFAPLSALIAVQSHEFSSDANAIGVALLFAHIWLLHPLSSLKRWGIVDKQKYFWPYVALGFVVKIFFWRSIIAASLWVIVLPVVLQYVGRWGLYMRLMHKYGQYIPSDSFEKRKQIWEFVALVSAFALAVMF